VEEGFGQSIDLSFGGKSQVLEGGVLAHQDEQRGQIRYRYGPQPVIRICHSAGTLNLVTGGLVCSFRLISIEFPPLDAAHQLFYLEAQPGHVQSATGGGIATDDVAVGDISSRPVEGGGRVFIHHAVRQIYRARDMFFFKTKALPGIDHDNVLIGLESGEEVGRVHFECQFVFIVFDRCFHHFIFYQI
jgi:hypothetical protein